MVEYTKTPVPLGEHVPTADRRVVMHGVGWKGYRAILAARGEDASSPRIAYLDGAVELMTPSRDHDKRSRLTVRLVEEYLEFLEMDYWSYGSWLIDDESEEAGAEPDECFIFGKDQSKDVPDLAVEVVWTSGGLNKLEIYRRLGVAEVWTWKGANILVHVLVDGAYVNVPRSTCLPGIDLALLCRLVVHTSKREAVREWRAALPAMKP